MQKLISCVCHQFAQTAFFSTLTHTMRKMSQHISIASNSLAMPSHNAWQAISLELAHLSLDFIYFRCCTPYLRDKREHEKRKQQMTTTLSIHLLWRTHTYINIWHDYIRIIWNWYVSFSLNAQKNMDKTKANEEIATSTCPCACVIRIFFDAFITSSYAIAITFSFGIIIHRAHRMRDIHEANCCCASNWKWNLFVRKEMKKILHWDTFK